MIRKEMAQKRKSLSPEQVQELSGLAIQRWLESSARLRLNARGLSVALYRSLPDEIDLRSLENEYQAQGARLAFPRIQDLGTGEMEMARAPESNARWESGPYALSEPPSESPVVPPESLELIVVPGVAFGPQGERVGRGKGFYDRYLGKASGALRVALAFDFQLVDRLPQNPWDQPVHWIVTESRELRLPAADIWLAERIHAGVSQ